ncbi:hypothetical protein [Streptomyces sp. NPDC056982]|uniref:DUF6197 family protein n=1 Tax=Streptomyces sp. NPDC056982 TaxID=3345986 RepID=UPI003638F290
MSRTQQRTPVRPQAPTRPVAPVGARVLPDTPDIPTWTQRLTPKHVRTALAGLGLYNNPTPQPPSIHLQQTLAVIERYGHCKSLAVSPTGRVCIHGAQGVLENAGYVTPQARGQAVQYMQEVLATWGVRMQFFAWNDLPDTPLKDVETLLTSASHRARANGA